MPSKSTEIFATASDMGTVLAKYEGKLFYYAFVPNREVEAVERIQSHHNVDGFWTSPSGFLGRTLLLVPKEGIQEPRRTLQNNGKEVFSLYPADVDCCVTLQEGGLFRQQECLIAGRMSVTHSDEWSQNLYKMLRREIVKAFQKSGRYYLGAEAMELAENGLRLTFQTTAPRHSDFAVS